MNGLTQAGIHCAFDASLEWIRYEACRPAPVCVLASRPFVARAACATEVGGQLVTSEIKSS